MNMSPDDDERGTVTGRLPSQPKIQFLKPPELTPWQQSVLKAVEDQKIAIIGVDYGAMEMAVISAMKHGKGVVVVDSVSSISGQKATFVSVDEFMHPDYCYFDEASTYNEYQWPEPTEPLDKPKLKQNGRSADYLKHNKVRSRR